MYKTETILNEFKCDIFVFLTNQNYITIFP